MFRVLSCVIFIIISNYVCINYLVYEIFLSDLHLGTGGSYKHFNKIYDRVLGFGIPDLLMIFFSCHGFLKNNDSVVTLKFPNRMFEYYFNKGFIIFDCDKNNLERIPYEIKDRIGAEVTENLDKVMICSTTITSTSNTLKKLLVNANSHFYNTKKEFNDKKEDIINILVQMLHHKSRKSTIRHCFINGYLILMLQCTNQTLTPTYINNLKKKKIHRVDSGEHWPISIK